MKTIEKIYQGLLIVFGLCCIFIVEGGLPYKVPLFVTFGLVLISTSVVNLVRREMNIAASVIQIGSAFVLLPIGPIFAILGIWLLWKASRDKKKEIANQTWQATTKAAPEFPVGTERTNIRTTRSIVWIVFWVLFFATWMEGVPALHTQSAQCLAECTHSRGYELAKDGKPEFKPKIKFKCSFPVFPFIIVSWHFSVFGELSGSGGFYVAVWYITNVKECMVYGWIS